MNCKKEKCIDLFLWSFNLTTWLTNYSCFCLLQKKQREFEEYIRDKYITAKADFRTLLKETKFITYRCVQRNVSCQQSLSLLVFTLMAKAYYAFTHMLTLLIFKNKKMPISTVLFFKKNFFFKERAQMSILYCVIYHSVFKTYFWFYFTAFF
jgi:hypothetical protein